jgi:hypothetical protein
MICEFEKRFRPFINYEPKSSMFSGLFTFDVEGADRITSSGVS